MTKPNGNRMLITAPERRFERGQGCWNCVHFNNGEISKKHWVSHKLRLLASLNGSAPLVRLAEQEKPIPGTVDARRDQIENMNASIEIGVVGMCLKGKRSAKDGGPEGDFVEHRFLCDRWNGRDGASVARQGQKPDLLPAELDERALERVKK